MVERFRGSEIPLLVGAPLLDEQRVGDLIRPVDFDEGRQYPLASLLQDEPFDSSDSFLIDSP